MRLSAVSFLQRLDSLGCVTEGIDVHRRTSDPQNQVPVIAKVQFRTVTLTGD